MPSGQFVFNILFFIYPIMDEFIAAHFDVDPEMLDDNQKDLLQDYIYQEEQEIWKDDEQLLELEAQESNLHVI